MKRVRPSSDIRPLAEVRAHITAVLAQVQRTRRPVVITQRGRSAAVLVHVKEYDALLDNLDLLRDIRTAERQLGRGEGVAHSRAKKQVLAKLGS